MGHLLDSFGNPNTAFLQTGLLATFPFTSAYVLAVFPDHVEPY
jgi:hypothetical protein